MNSCCRFPVSNQIRKESIVHTSAIHDCNGTFHDASVVSHVYCRVQSYPDVPRQGAVRREWLVLCKGCTKVGALGDAILEHQGSSLRAGREAAVRCVALLGKDTPFPAKHALRSTASRPAEPYNIRVTLH